MQRWVAFFVAVVLAAGVLAGATGMTRPAIQRVPCNPDRVLEDQRDAADELARWVWRNLLLVGGLAALCSFLAFYLQLFQRAAGRLATPARLLWCMALAWLGGWLVVDVAAAWAGQQTGSCLEEALDVPSVANRISLSDSLPVLDTQVATAGGWRLAVTADMALLVVVSVIGGLTLYWLAWRLRRF